MEFKFRGYNPTLKHRQSDKSVIVAIETSLDEYDHVKDILKAPEGLYEVTIKPVIE